jgi:hypothetical protein
MIKRMIKTINRMIIRNDLKNIARLLKKVYDIKHRNSVSFGILGLTVGNKVLVGYEHMKVIEGYYSKIYDSENKKEELKLEE